MARHYRYRLPRWLNRCICVLESAIVPILIFQLIRTLIFPSTLDLFILGILVGIFIAYYLEFL